MGHAKKRGTYDQRVAQSKKGIKTYDTELKYTGAITFGEYWCYFDQIDEVIKRNEYVEDTAWMKEESDVDIALNLEAEQQIGK